jgi:hypothetical protein
VLFLSHPIPKLAESSFEKESIVSNPIRAIRPVEANIDLPGGQSLLIHTDGDDSVIRIESYGVTVLSIRVTAQGAELRFEDGLKMRAEGKLTLDGDQVTIRAREELRLESSGEAHIQVSGDLYTEARVQNIKATLGNINLKANDDVKLTAERILLNC